MDGASRRDQITWTLLLQSPELISLVEVDHANYELSTNLARIDTIVVREKWRASFGIQTVPMLGHNLWGLYRPVKGHRGVALIRDSLAFVSNEVSRKGSRDWRWHRYAEPDIS